MKYIIVSDIFGKTPALALLSESICTIGDAHIVTPYGNNDYYFLNESEAYEYFTQHVGIERYYKELNEHLLSIKQPFRLIGFSVGAAVCWQYIAKNNSENVIQSDLFYGSQIRNMQSLEPKSPVNLIMPKSEDHFSVNDLIEVLMVKKHTSIDHTKYLHGFMNPLSKHYCQQAYDYYVNVLST